MLSLIASVPWAGAKIEFDTHRFDGGSLMENKNDRLMARFVVKNTGDAPLEIRSVRPSCSCLSLNFPRRIAPGQSAPLTAEASVKGYPSGPLSKSLLVISNAANEPTAKLTINATRLVLVDISQGFVRLDAGKPDSATLLFVAARKTDLQITQASFRDTDSHGIWEWLTGASLPVKYTWTATDSTRRSDGYRVYQLRLFAPPVAEPMTGTFTLKTNYAEKPRILLAGKISK
jgi:hypothetical protein